MTKNLWTWIIGLAVLPLVAFGLLLAVVFQAAGAMSLGQSSGCSAPVGVVSDLSATAQPTPIAGTPTLPASDATATAISLGENICYSGSPYGSAVVQWAKQMADALYIDPSCGNKRGGTCNDTWYTSAFPQPVLHYGQTWCNAHNDCSDWANSTYQCVSFVRGAYSQVYPMNYSNDAFGLWATYQHLPGWQEIPAAATPDVAQRFLPEPGDVMVFKDLGVGHVAIVLQVQPPQNGTNGWVAFANANSSSAYDRMPLMPSLLVDTREWGSSGVAFTVWGYIRPQPAAVQKVVRINQLDPGQYASQSEYQTWANSACSAAAMTEVLDASGLHMRIHDVLTVEAGLKEITPAGGLQEDVGIANTMRQFGLKTTWGENWSLAQVVGTANSGQPVIVSWPPSRYAGGHLVVVTGGDLATGIITIADSSRWNRSTVSVTQFLQWWAGFAAVSARV
ncbi:MAG: CHAP domain-containing protein [Ktedonobacteraceae bacterium]